MADIPSPTLPADAGPTPALVLVLSGPSGAGKSSLIRRFLADHPDVVPSVSATTRAPRPGEVEGRDYVFLQEGDFQARIDAGGFLEYAQVFGTHHYGTPRTFIDEQLQAGRSVIMDIDVQGARQVARSMPEAVRIFVAPPDRSELERRLRDRGTEDEAAIARRLAEADAELAHWREFHYLIVNDDLDRAAGKLRACYVAERARASRR